MRLVQIPKTYPALRVGEIQRSIRCPLRIRLLSIDIMPRAETVGRTDVLLIDSDLKTDEETCHYPKAHQDGDDDRNDPFPVL